MVSSRQQFNSIFKLTQFVYLPPSRQRVHRPLESAATRPTRFAVVVAALPTTFKSRYARSADIQLPRPVHVSSMSREPRSASDKLSIPHFRQLVGEGQAKEDHRNRTLPLLESRASPLPQRIPRGHPG